MDIVERNRGDRRRLIRLIAKESDAMQRDRLRSVLLVLQGRQALEVADAVGRSRRFVQRWAYAYRDGGIEAVCGQPTPRLETASRNFEGRRLRGSWITGSARPFLSSGSTSR